MCGKIRIIASDRAKHELGKGNRPIQRCDCLKLSHFPYFRESVETYHRKLERLPARATDLAMPLLFKVEREKLASLPVECSQARVYNRARLHLVAMRDSLFHAHTQCGLW